MPHGPYLDLVAKAQADLHAAGVDLSGDCGAWKVTNLAVWYINRSGDPGAGLLSKTAGSGCVQQGTLYAKDAIVYKEGGEVYDVIIASGAKGGNGEPAWNRGEDRSDVPGLWRPALDPSFYVQMTAPPPPVDQPPTTNPSPVVDLSPLLTRIDTLETTQQAIIDTLNRLTSWQDHVGQVFINETAPQIAALQARKVPIGVSASARIFGTSIPIHAELTYE